MRRLTALTALAVLLLGGCASAVAQPAPPPAAAAPTSVREAAPAGYTLGSGDKVRIVVFAEPNLSGDYQISGTGMVAVPLVGDVKAAGLTAPAFANAVRDRLSEGYLRNPKVTAEVLLYRPYYILGEVSRPGEYPFSNDLTVMNAVATAGGFSYRADKKYVFLRHQGAAAEERVRLTASTPVAPGDTVRFRERLF